MEETQEYWEQKIAEFNEAIEAEMSMDVQNDEMIKLLKFERDECLKQLQ